jgi:PAS domain S-box-containing protein
MPLDPADLSTARAASSPEPRLLALQVEEVYRFAPTAAAFSYFGALLTLGVLVEIGETVGGALWFLFASAVTFLRAFLIIAYRRRTPEADLGRYARGMVVANVLAGVQWGLLGTVLFPAAPVYAQLFTLMVIICFVAGSVTAYAALRGAHEALSIPATIPTSIYVFFLHDGVHWYAGIAALFFCFAIIHYSGKLHRYLAASYRLQMERDDLVQLTRMLNERLEGEKSELAHRAAVRGVSAETARDEAARLSALFERSPLPQLECDANGIVITSNTAAQRFFGRSRSELAGAPLTSLMSSSAQHDAGLLNVSTPRTVDVDVSAADGSRIACAASLTPLPAAPGQRAGFGIVVAGVPHMRTGVPLA